MDTLTEDDRDRLTRGLDQLRSENWENAWFEFQGISQPCNPLVQINLAFIEEKRGHPIQAHEHYQQALSLAPQSTEVRFNWANFLARHHGQHEARDQYLACLTLDPSHLGAWVNLGVGLVESFHLSAARTTFQAALALDPNHLGALLNLAQVALHQQENQEAAMLFRQLLVIDPNQIEAHRGLATALSRCGDENAANSHRDLAYQDHPLLEFPSIQTTTHRLLILASAHDGNVPWQNLIDRNHASTQVIALEYFPKHQPLPAHDMLFNAVGDADRCPQALREAQRLWPQQGPRRNDPHRISPTTRIQLPSTLAQIPHLRIARCELWTRPVHDSVIAAQVFHHWMKQQGWDFPLLLRTPGFHGGQFFEKVNHDHELPSMLQRLPGGVLLVSELLPTRSSDQCYRKYRIMSLGGNLYPLHLAISHQWKVHYFSAEMASHAEYRHEEATFLNKFDEYLPPQALAALYHVQQRLGLDYAGMDFSLDCDGQVILFEANATMVIAPPPEDPNWNYRRPAYEHAHQQAKSLLAPLTY